MKQKFFIFISLLFVLYACDEPAYPKPENLVKEKQMINMMVDMHIAQALYTSRRSADSLLTKTTSEDFYYSILKKYNVPDSVFEESFVYYAGNPKNFEKMYRQVLDKLNQMDEEYSGRNNEPLEFDKLKQ